MTLRRRARDARFSTRRLDSDSRTSVRRRRRAEVQFDWATKAPARVQEDWVLAQSARNWLTEESEAEARDEGMDGLHSDEA
jgi:hypothetical protein